MDTPVKTLFDHCILEPYRLPKHGESMFGYINSVNREGCLKIKGTIDGWFNKVDNEDEKLRLWRDFRSRDIRKQHAALFELYLHEFLLRLGYVVQFHPTISGTDKTPDFLLMRNNVPQFYLEAKVSAESDREYAHEVQKLKIYDCIEEMPLTDFHLGIEIENSSDITPSCKEIKTFIQNKINLLNPEQMRQDEHNDDSHDFVWEQQGWRINFQPLVKIKSSKSRRNIAALHFGVGSVQSVQKIRRGIQRKSKYGKLKLPFVLALNVFEPVTLDNSEIAAALFGDEVVHFSAKKEGGYNTELARKSNGSWMYGRQKKYSRFSALVIAHNLDFWNLPSKDLMVWHHPFPDIALLEDKIPLNRMVPNYDSGRMQKKTGVSVRTLFSDLPDYWETMTD